jgi:ABC-type phosphate/phosphonate transport system permease subunit
LLLVTAVGLGHFSGRPGALGSLDRVLGRLFAETIEHLDMAPIDALTLTGARHVQVFNHGVIPSILPSLLGIALYRFDENIRSSRSVGFVSAGGIGGELLSGMSLFRACRRPRNAIQNCIGKGSLAASAANLQQEFPFRLQDRRKRQIAGGAG